MRDTTEGSNEHGVSGSNRELAFPRRADQYDKWWHEGRHCWIVEWYHNGLPIDGRCFRTESEANYVIRQWLQSKSA